MKKETQFNRYSFTRVLEKSVEKQEVRVESG